MVTWAGIDMPWLAVAETGRFAATLQEVRRLAPDLVLSSHLPPARSMTADLLDHLAVTMQTLADRVVPA